jgi:nucleoside 2-deoxyribosyltransferase
MNLFLIFPFSIDNQIPGKLEIISEIALKHKVKIIDENFNVHRFNSENSLLLLDRADFVIADLSYERPSCYYEVGYAQAKNKLVFLIANFGTIIFQVRDKSKIQYYSNLYDYRIIIDEIITKISKESN